MSTNNKEDVIIGDIRELTGLPFITPDDKTATPFEEKRDANIQKLQDTFVPNTDIVFEDEGGDKATPVVKKEEKVAEVVADKPKTEEILIDDKGEKATNKFSQKVKALIEEGFYEDFEIEEGVFFADADLDLTEEQYKDIVAKQKVWKEEAAQEEVLGKLSPEEQEFITYKKNGGDLNSYLQTFSFKQKASDLDITTDNGKKSAIFAYYKNFVGWEEEKVLKYIATCEKNLDLDDEAATAKDYIVKAANAEHKTLVDANARRVEEVKENEKEYKKAIDGALKKLNVEPKQAITIVKAFTQKDERGFADIDKMYLSLKNDPEKTALLYNMLSNPEEFIKNTTKKAASDTKLIEIRKHKIAGKIVENSAAGAGEKEEGANLRQIFFSK